MRLVHAVLLPGIIVMVSNGNLLHAHALYEDETGVTAGRQLRAAASEDFGLSRASFELAMAQDPLDKFFSMLKNSGKPIETSYSAKGIHKKIIEAHDLHVSKSNEAPVPSVMYARLAEHLKKIYSDKEIELIVSTLEHHDDVRARNLGVDIWNAHERKKL
uniref:Avirulence protein n=1 Tax=Hyaloperonospora parasitica TaxID=123356 RepID=B2CSN0_9STRA|nr:avirulence protein [Hyaloperonospora parasitica]